MVGARDRSPDMAVGASRRSHSSERRPRRPLFLAPADVLVGLTHKVDLDAVRHAADVTRTRSRAVLLEDDRAVVTAEVIAGLSAAMRVEVADRAEARRAVRRAPALVVDGPILAINAWVSAVEVEISDMAVEAALPRAARQQILTVLGAALR